MEGYSSIQKAAYLYGINYLISWEDPLKNWRKIVYIDVEIVGHILDTKFGGSCRDSAKKLFRLLPNVLVWLNDTFLSPQPITSNKFGENKVNKTNRQRNIYLNTINMQHKHVSVCSVSDLPCENTSK